MSKIETTRLATLDNGRHILATLTGGSVRIGTQKDGSPLMADFTPASFILGDGVEDIVVGPIVPDAALALAREVAQGNARAMTEPQTALILATALLGIDTLSAPATSFTPAEGDADAWLDRVYRYLAEGDCNAAMEELQREFGLAPPSHARAIADLLSGRKGCNHVQSQ